MPGGASLNKVLNHLEEWLIAFLMGGGDDRDFRLRGSSLRLGNSLARAAGLAAHHQPELGPGIVHLHVRLDGQVRRCLRRADRHPRRRRCPGQPAAGQDEDRSSSYSACSPARCLPASSARSAQSSYGKSPIPTRSRPTWKCRCGSFFWRSRCGSYLMCFRFLQVTWSFWRTGELPHHEHGHVEGIEEVKR